MTNEEIIAKIKAEIGKKVLEAPINAEGHQRVWAYNDVIDLLSTLESEKPMQDEFEKEMDKYVEENGLVNCSEIVPIARHFAKWGAEHLKK